MPPDFITPAEAAARWGKGRSTVNSWCKLGLIPGAQQMSSGAWLIPADATQPHPPQGGRAHRRKETTE